MLEDSNEIQENQNEIQQQVPPPAPEDMEKEVAGPTPDDGIREKVNQNAEKMKVDENVGPDSTKKPKHDPIKAVQDQMAEIIQSVKNTPLYKSLEEKLENLKKELA